MKRKVHNHNPIGIVCVKPKYSTLIYLAPITAFDPACQNRNKLFRRDNHVFIAHHLCLCKASSFAHSVFIPPHLFQGITCQFASQQISVQFTFFKNLSSTLDVALYLQPSANQHNGHPLNLGIEYPTHLFIASTLNE